MAKIGRPRVEGENIMLRLPNNMIDAIDALRKQDPQLPSRQEVVRQALAEYMRKMGFLDGE